MGVLILGAQDWEIVDHIKHNRDIKGTKGMSLYHVDELKQLLPEPKCKKHIAEYLRLANLDTHSFANVQHCDCALTVEVDKGRAIFQYT